MSDAVNLSMIVVPWPLTPGRLIARGTTVEAVLRSIYCRCCKAFRDPYFFLVKCGL